MKRRIGKAPVIQEKVFFQGDKEVKQPDVIKSYKFGKTMVPFSADDKAATKLQTEKCCQVIGFTSKKYVPRHMLVGDTCYYVVPRDGNKSAMIAVTALVKALLKQDMVAIVRKVYQKNRAPKMGVLMPTHENNSYFFYYAQIPFAEDINKLKNPTADNKPSQKDKASTSSSFDDDLTQEEIDAMDGFLDAMQASKCREDGELGHPMLNPMTEHLNNLIVFKALNPGAPLPTEPSPSVMNLVKMKPEVCENIQNSIQILKNVFPLKEVEQKTYRRGAAEVFKRNSDGNIKVKDTTSETLGSGMASFVQSTVTEVGTVNPEDNFVKLLGQGEPFVKICEQMQTAIRKLFLTSNSVVGIKKPISALVLLRRHCVLKDPLLFNVFIASLKDDITERCQQEIWDEIIQENLGLITMNENKESNISVEEAEFFYQIKKTETEKVHDIEMEAENMMDLL